MSSVLSDAAEVDAAIVGLGDDDGWSVCRDDTLRMLYKHEVSAMHDMLACVFHAALCCATLCCIAGCFDTAGAAL